jgi:hypothetical protein
MNFASCTELLFEAVGRESDRALALSIVLRMPGELPPEKRNEWITQLRSEKDRDYATTRKDEIGILECALERPANLNWDERQALGWSDWLQLRLATAATDRRLVGCLAEHGRTKRIRRISRDRLGVPNGD